MNIKLSLANAHVPSGHVRWRLKACSVQDQCQHTTYLHVNTHIYIFVSIHVYMYLYINSMYGGVYWPAELQGFTCRVSHIYIYI